MEIVLKKDHPSLGKALDVVTVKDGFARNFLFPQGIAVPATEGNKKTVAEARRTQDKRDARKLAEAQELAKKIEKVPCTIPVKVGEEDRIFGSVTSMDIVGLLAKEGYTIDKSAVELAEPIKQLGVYTVNVKLYSTVTAAIKVWVVKEESK
jgi:large subunit ribosomal protein L9